MASLYLNPDLAPDAAPGARVTVGGEEARHAVTVARVRVGERVAVGNGAGLMVWGAVIAADPRELSIEVDTVTREPQPAPQLWLAQALAKGDRDELAVQAATELGVAGVIPWLAERSVSRWEGAKVERGRQRWLAVVREATKQSIRGWIPDVSALATTAQLATLPGTILVLDPLGTTALTDAPLSESRITVVVGPEGGIATREFETLEAAGAVRVRLGAEVLRTSTAGPAAFAVINSRLGRW